MSRKVHRGAHEKALRVFTTRLWRIAQGEPMGVMHAAQPGSGTTLCGLSVPGLVEFAHSGYAGLRDRVRCDVCNEAATIAP